jgi:hypothetical protein
MVSLKTKLSVFGFDPNRSPFGLGGDRIAERNRPVVSPEGQLHTPRWILIVPKPDNHLIVMVAYLTALAIYGTPHMILMAPRNLCHDETAEQIGFAVQRQTEGRI